MGTTAVTPQSQDYWQLTPPPTVAPKPATDQGYWQITPPKPAVPDMASVPGAAPGTPSPLQTPRPAAPQMQEQALMPQTPAERQASAPPAPPSAPSVQAPTGMASVSAAAPTNWERLKMAVPSLGEVADIASGRKPAMAPMRAEDVTQLAYPERIYTPTEQEQHPIRTGVDQFLGGLTTPENLLLTQGFGALGILPGKAAAVIPRLASAGFGMQMIHDAIKETPEALAAWKRGDHGEAERIGTQVVLTTIMAGMAGTHAALGSKGSLFTTPEERAAVERDMLTREARTIVNSAGMEYPYNPTPEDMKASSRQYQARAANAPEADQPAMKDKFNRLHEIHDRLTKMAEPEKPSSPDYWKLESPEGKPVHASNDVEELRASAERQAPKIGDAVAEAAEKVPGAKLEAVRDSKDTDRIEDKAARQGVEPSQISDIAAAKVTVPDQAAAEQVLSHLNEKLPVQSVNGSVTGEPGKNGVRQLQSVVKTGTPGEPVRHAEVLVQSPEMHAATEDTHDQYRQAQELRAQGKEAEAAAIEKEITGTHDAAEQAAQQRLEARNAIPESGRDAVGEREQGKTQGENERGRVEPSQQGNETPAARPQAAGEKETDVVPVFGGQSETKPRQPGQAPIPPLSRTLENLKDQQVEVRSGDTWRPGKILADAITTDARGMQLRRLRGEYDDGTKFDNVKVSDVRKAPNGQSSPVSRESDRGASVARPEARQVSTASRDQGQIGKNAIGVDFDGTLFTENADGTIGKPIPERIASLKRDLANGDNVVIESRRASRPGEVENIHRALESVGLPRLPVTAKKDASPELIGDKEKQQPGVKLDKVATNANTPLPEIERKPGQGPVPPERAEAKKQTPESLLKGESGSFDISKLSPKHIRSEYDKAVKELISGKLKMGDKYYDVAKQDEQVATDLHLVDNGPRYFKAKADANLAKVTAGLTEDQTRLASLMVDSDSRDYLKEHKPDEYKQALNDPAVMAAVDRFKPLQEELTEDRQALGWPVRKSLTIEENKNAAEDEPKWNVVDRQGTVVDSFKTEGRAQKFIDQNAEVEPHLKRTYPEHSRNPLPGDVGAGEAVGSFPHDKGLRPPKMDKKSREMSAAYHYEHGRKDFSGYIDSFKQTKTAMLKQKLFDDFTANATTYAQGTAQPPQIEYNGKTYYRPDIVAKAKQGGKDLPAYGVYDPTRGERFLVFNPAEEWATLATGKPGIKPTDRFLGPKTVVDAMENYDSSRGGEQGKLRKFFQEQIVGLFGPMVHINNIVRHIGQATGLGTFDPRSWPSIARVIASPDLRARVMKGVDDATIDMLAKYGAYTDWGDIGNLNRYIGGNLNPGNWIRTFGKGVLFDPKFAKGWGGLDPKARIVVADYFKDHYPQMSEQEIARAVEDGFGNYNRANWTERQRLLAKFTLFPGWDAASIKWFLRHPFRVGAAGALVTLAINQALKALGKNKGDESTDVSYIHIGDRKFKSGLITDSMGDHLMAPVLGAIQSKLQGEDVGAGVAEGGMRGTSALAGTLAGPVVEMVADQVYNRKYAGGGAELVKPEDKYTPGTWAPNVELEKRIAFAALKGVPALNRFIDQKGQWDWAQGLGGGVLGLTNFKYGAEERFKANASKAYVYAQTLDQLAQTNPEAAAEYVKDPVKATYLMFHDDLSSMGRDLREIDQQIERVRSSDLPSTVRAAALEDLKNNRNLLLKAADSMGDALTEAKESARK